jgi:DNA ligase-4
VDILQELYGSLEANQAAVITQIILKDLNPILYPIGIINTTRNLLSNDPAPAKLSLMQCLAAWDPHLPRIYRIHSSFEEAFEFLENKDELSIVPKVGVPIMVSGALETCLRAKKALDSKVLQGEVMQGCIETSKFCNSSLL